MKLKEYINQVILNSIQDLQRLSLSLLNSMRGRSRIKYGMTSLFNNDGFTPLVTPQGLCAGYRGGPHTISRTTTLRDDVVCGPRGFTLIELLVVVLIIGILAAVAVPQYQKAVRKSRAVQVKTLMLSIHRAQRLCNLARGTTQSNECALLSNLDIDIPFSCTESTPTTSCTIGPCAWNNTCTLYVNPAGTRIQEYPSNGTLSVLLYLNSDEITFGGGGRPGVFDVNDYTGPYKD